LLSRKELAMMSRRTVLGGPAFGGLLASLAPTAGAEAAPEPAMQKTSEEAMALQEVVKALIGLKDEIKRENEFWELNALRDPIRTFLRTTGKYPDYMEVGIDTWHNVHDWYIRRMQPPAIGRNADGRYTIMLMGTMLIMRVDTQPGYVGIPFDNR
jgi:hypothetical protein